jgi:hypothetical protein
MIVAGIFFLLGLGIGIAILGFLASRGQRIMAEQCSATGHVWEPSNYTTKLQCTRCGKIA